MDELMCYVHPPATVRTRFLVVCLLLFSLVPVNPVSATGGVEITQILVSPSDAAHNGTDWNGDGYIDKESDQYIMITNTGSEIVDISDWILDDITGGGSPSCRIGWNTSLAAGESITFYRANTHIDLDYWDGDTATLMNKEGELIHSMSYPAEDSWYDKAYTVLENGTLWKIDPSPSARQGTCFKQSDNTETEYILKGRIVPMTGQNNVIENGNVMIDAGKIVAVWADGEIPPLNTDNITTHDTEASIYPGLIDLHNHMHYNHIPLWDFNVHLSDSQKSDEGGYTNRYQWGNNYDYGPSITWMKNNIQDYNRWDMSNEQMKFAEVQAVAGGVTAVQGSPSSGTDAWDSMLSRNVELYNFGQDGMYTCAVCEPTDPDYNAQYIIGKNESGTLNGWFVHLSEGVDSSSKAEFDTLFDKGLIMDETVVIHGTALDQSQFEKMAQKGAGLVWSPISNLLLYGDTTDVVAADNAGVTISLAPDWGPSGSKNNLHELKVADLWNKEVLSGHFSDYELAEMVTSNAAKIANWQDFVGQIETGMYADLVIIDTFHENPYRNLIEAIDPDVRLTIVHGKAVFGDIDLMTAMQGDDWEYLNGSGFSKAVDVTSSTEADGMQTWENIEAGLSMAMRNEFDDIKSNWNDVSDMTDSEIEDWLATTFDGDYRDEVNHLKNLTLDPIYTMNDERYFDVINRSAHANFHVEMSKLYDYYDVQYDENSDRTFIEDPDYANGIEDPDPDPDPNTDPDPDPNTDPSQENNSEDTNNNQNEISCIGIGCEDDTILVTTESEEQSPIVMLSIIMGVILIAAIVVIFFSQEKKDEEEELAEEVAVWDDNEFVPEMPPIEPPKD